MTSQAPRKLLFHLTPDIFLKRTAGQQGLFTSTGLFYCYLSCVSLTKVAQTIKMEKFVESPTDGDVVCFLSPDPHCSCTQPHRTSLLCGRRINSAWVLNRVQALTIPVPPRSPASLGVPRLCSDLHPRSLQTLQSLRHGTLFRRRE